ncbi:hypothetical protein V2J09_023158 [Rumex salicifolius]
MAGAQCCNNPPELNANCGDGHVELIGGLNCYISGSSDSKLAVLLISDIFGSTPFYHCYESPNLRKLADKVAGTGFYVVAPDFFHGDPFSYENADRPLPIWIKDHGMDKGFEEAKPVIQALNENGISKIGAAGFCWGAKVVVLLAQSDYIQAAVLLHPSFVSVDDIKCVKSPIAVLGAEMDHMSPPELIKQFEEILNSKPEVESFVKIFPGVSHGWTVRYNTDDEPEVKSAEEAHRDMLAWFSKYIQ